MAERVCPRCGREQPGTSELKQCVYCGADISEPPEAPAPDAVPPAAEPPAPTPEPVAGPPADPAAEPVPEGKRKCPECGELLYESERRCWRCGHELVPGDVTEAAVPPAAAPESPPVQPPVVASSAPPVQPPVVAPSTSPPPYQPPLAAPTVPPTPPYYPATTPPAPEAGAQNLGIWALVLGLLGFCCPVLGSIAAIILGVQARRAGASGLGTAGIVLGIIALIMWASVLLGAGGFIAQAFKEGFEEGYKGSSSSLWGVRWLLS